jgi:hypothetical protein
MADSADCGCLQPQSAIDHVEKKILIAKRPARDKKEGEGNKDGDAKQ